MALSVGVGLGVLAELMEAEVDEVVGPKGKHDPAREAKRHGHEQTSVTLGARRTPISRPCVRSADDLLRLFGPVLLALLALSIRARVKR